MRHKIVKIISFMTLIFLVPCLLISVSGIAKSYEDMNNYIEFTPSIDNNQNVVSSTPMDTIDVTMHVHVFKTTVFDAKCETEGWTLEECDCGYYAYKNKVEKLGHDFESQTIKPTYTTNGYDEHVCRRCNHSYRNNYTEIIQHAHEYATKKISATCSKNGYTSFTCRLCGYNYIDNETTALGHDYKTETILPTPKKQGYDLHTCVRCSKQYKNNYTEPVITYKNVNETVYANTTVNIRTGPSTKHEKIGQLSAGQSIARIGVGDNGWSKVLYNDKPAYMFSDYLQTTKPAIVQSDNYPMSYSDKTCTITIYKEWYKNAYVYAAHLQFSDYSRFGTACANGKYDNGYEKTSHAAKRLGAIFAVNGCYSAPYLGYTVIREGKIWNGADRSLCIPAVYSNNTGLLLNGYESGDSSIVGQNVQSLVDAGKVTDTFCFGGPNLINGEILGKNEGARAQRTFIGTNGNAGDIWICVSDGRYNDNESAGLTFYEAAEYLKEKGCTFGVHLDGGGSSTMYFNGKVLNAAKKGQRAVVDFVYFK